MSRAKKRKGKLHLFPQFAKRWFEIVKQEIYEHKWFIRVNVLLMRKRTSVY